MIESDFKPFKSLKSKSFNLLENIYFFAIGRYQANDSFFNWESKNYNKSSFFELKLTRNPPIKNNFYCLNKPEIKMVYYAHEETDTVFTIGAQPLIQSQTLEAIIEYLIIHFFDMYDKSLLSAIYGDKCSIFNEFTSVVVDTLENLPNLDLIKVAMVPCKVCKKLITVIVKKSIIENSQKSHIPFVYLHSGHAILVYFNRNFTVRDTEFVQISY